MPLVTKMIRYPDEKKAMGILNSGGYSSQGTQESSYESIKNCIIDIHDFFVNDLKLTHKISDGELDLNDIKNLNLDTLSKQSNVLNPDEFLSYGFKDYSFNDDLQNEVPLTLRINFGVKNLADKSSNLVFSHRFAFTILIDVFIKDRMIHSFNPTQSFTNRTPVNNAWYYNYTEELLSKGFYSGDRIFVDIIPNRRVSYCSRFDVNTTKLFPYIKFYIERNQEFTIIRSHTITKNYGSNDNSIWDPTSINFVYINNNEDIKFETQENYYIPFLSKANIANNNYGVYRTVDIDPLTNITYENNNVMIGYSNQLINSNIEVEIDINGEIETYYVITPSQYDITYTFDQKIATLYKVD